MAPVRLCLPSNFCNPIISFWQSSSTSAKLQTVQPFCLAQTCTSLQLWGWQTIQPFDQALQPLRLHNRCAHVVDMLTRMLIKWPMPSQLAEHKCTLKKRRFLMGVASACADCTGFSGILKFAMCHANTPSISKPVTSNFRYTVICSLCCNLHCMLQSGWPHKLAPGRAMCKASLMVGPKSTAGISGGNGSWQGSSGTACSGREASSHTCNCHTYKLKAHVYTLVRCVYQQTSLQARH